MFTIRKAERKQAKLRLALSGIQNSGKSTGAINIAIGLGGKFVVIDTERNSADLYSDLADFDVLEIEAPFSPDKYITAIKQCEQAGYTTIIIDSLSHAYAGEGGLLDIADNITKASKTKNSFIAWKEATPLQNKLVDAMLQSNSHIITTMRCKAHYDLVEENGRKRPVKMGLAPIQRDGIEYEFTVVLELDHESHLYTATKDRTRLFSGKHGNITKETGKELLDWLMCGKSKEEVDKEECDRFKSEMLIANDLNRLREIYKNARSRLPSLESEFLVIADKRKLELLQTNEEVH